ncbi:MAG: hypothetical protein ABIK96_01500 [bacterium]
MSEYPRDLTASEISSALHALVRGLAERLLTGPAPEHAVLRKQLKTGRLARITLTGAGLYAHFEHEPGTPRVSPADIIGGEVLMDVYSLDAPAGSLVKVSDGWLDFVEIYTFGNCPWPDEFQILAFGEATPLPIAGRTT